MATVPGLITSARRRFHARLADLVFFRNAEGILSNADKGSRASVNLAEGIAKRLNVTKTLPKHLKGQEAGALFERVCREFVSSTFPKLTHIRPGTWSVSNVNPSGMEFEGIPAKIEKLDIAKYEQYSHLQKLADIAASDRELAAVLQSDYLITPDVVIARMPEADEALNQGLVVVDDAAAHLASLRRANNELPILHASISCKWTLRSDRGQNVRTEGLNLVKNRKGHLPHVVFVTGEPVPARIASIAMGTGEVDCVYHFALPELQQATREMGYEDAAEMLAIMVEGHRLKDISDLPLDLAV